MTNYEVLKQIGLKLNRTATAKLFEGADMICYHEPEEGNRCHLHDGLCEKCVPVWLDEEASPKMLQLIQKGVEE